MTEDKVVGWHHQLNGHEFEQASGDGEEQKSLARCSPGGYKELNMTEQLNKKEGERNGLAEHRGFLVEWKYFVLHYSGEYTSL